jgi:peptidoglycan/xylan/chitin deacetylase (PgdA/CDA1 family)
MASTPLVSIVVPAYNEEYVLEDCLVALQQQDYSGPYEIIVVNNASTDRTPEIARSLGARVVDEPAKGYVRALRAGFAAAQGDIIACTDADTIVPPDWLSRLVAALTSRSDVVAAAGTFAFHDGPAWLRFLSRLLGRCNWDVSGGNMAVWRWAYQALGGFDPTVNMGADRELGLRLRRIGRTIVIRDLVALTSARRFEAAFWSTIWLYAVNDLSLILTGRPHFFDFPDIRIPVRPRLTRRQVSYAAVAVPAMVLLALLLFLESPDRQVFGPVLAKAASARPVVALTFDDGPSTHTAEVLDILARYHVKATFFLIGRNVERYPELARRIVAEGHAVGNHTYTHPIWAAIEGSQHVQRELDNCEKAIELATGIHATIFRPPHGWRSPWMIRQARREGYTVITWSVSPDDWRRPAPQVITERVLQGVKPGAIILLHDGLEMRGAPPVQNTVAALPAIIEGLRARGYEFVTVPELIQKKDFPGIVLRSPMEAACCP